MEERHLLILSTKISSRREEISIKLFSNLINREGELCLDFTVYTVAMEISVCNLDGDNQNGACVPSYRSRFSHYLALKW
ncbi:hypothetical protein VNO77_44731 [Canavalia gladiata]|uniref:Uncharacterized protein n=1 Tax=Canavalia gladiata TaxID=3824 RepID=A0AAN9K070_CANGL